MCFALVSLVGGERVAYGYCRACCICLDASISQCTTLATASCSSRHFHPSLLSFLFGYLILTLRWLSRYDSDLLLDLWSALFFIRYRLYGFLSVAGIVLCLLLDLRSSLIGIPNTAKAVRIPSSTKQKQVPRIVLPRHYHNHYQHSINPLARCALLRYKLVQGAKSAVCA